MPRRHWFQLPAGVRAAVERRTGAVRQAWPVAAGSVSDLAAILDTRDGEVFCKAAVADNPRAWMHRHEARFNAYVPAFAPRLRWHFEEDGWIVLGFDRVPGRHVNLALGSPDLPVLAATLTAMAATPAPAPPVRVQPATARWAEWLAPDLVDGDTLVHTDVTAKNFLIHGESIAVVDWAMPCRGAAWIDAALLVIRLVRAGQTPAQAEQWAAQTPAWRAADHHAVTAFAAGCAKRANDRAHQAPAAHLRQLADAAEQWATYRGATFTAPIPPHT